MHRTPLVIGLVLVLAAVFLLNQGTQVLIPLSENLGLTSHYAKEDVIVPPTLYTVPSSNYTYASADLMGLSEVSGSLQVSDARQVAFYVMGQGNFSLWERGRPSVVILSQPLAVSYNFTFSPSEPGTYFFIFDNQNNSPCSVVFTISAVENVTVLNPFVQNAGFELLIVGVVLSYVGLKGGSRKKAAPIAAPEISGWKCKFCGAVNSDPQAQFCANCDRSRE